MRAKDKSQERIYNFQKLLIIHDFDAAVIMQSRDIFYYCDVCVPSIFLVTQNDFRLFIISGIEFVKRDTRIDSAYICEGSLTEVMELLINWGFNKKTVGTELDCIPGNYYLKIRKKMPFAKIRDITPIVMKQRRIKDEYEIECIRSACKIADVGHQTIPKVFREGMTELELSAEIEYAMRMAGDEGCQIMRNPTHFVTRTVIGSGSNLLQWTGMAYTITGVGPSRALPMGPSKKQIVEGDIITVDLGGMYRGYYSDESRTYIVGKPKKEVTVIYSKLKRICDYILDKLEPGIVSSEICKMALRKARHLNIESQFLYLTDNRKSKGIGHGIGLEINEPPFLTNNEQTVLASGFILALEMHVGSPQIAFAKLEDNVLINEINSEILTLSPRELVEL
jgi:Xaa-Pro aminopeptidase